MVKDVIKRTRGAAGSLVINADGWRRILVSGTFATVEENLRKSIK